MSTGRVGFIFSRSGPGRVQVGSGLNKKTPANDCRGGRWWESGDDTAAELLRQSLEKGAAIGTHAPPRIGMADPFAFFDRLDLLQM